MDEYLITEYPMIIHYTWLQKKAPRYGKTDISHQEYQKRMDYAITGYAVTEPDSQVSESLNRENAHALSFGRSPPRYVSMIYRGRFLVSR